MANQSYRYSLNDKKNVSGLVSVVNEYLQSKNMETQHLTDDSGNDVLQARAVKGKLKQFIGMDKAITVHFVKQDTDVTMEIGEAKWVDKGAVLVLSLFVLWPLTITSGIGIYKQQQLPKGIKKAADDYMEISETSVFTEKTRLNNPGKKNAVERFVDNADVQSAINNINDFVSKNSYDLANMLYRLICR